MDTAKPMVLALESDRDLLRHDLHERFLALYDESRIVVDLTGLKHVDTSVLSELALMRTHRRGAGYLLGRLVVRTEEARAALALVGFDHHWPIYATLEEAVASFDGPPLYA